MNDEGKVKVQVSVKLEKIDAESGKVVDTIEYTDEQYVVKSELGELYGHNDSGNDRNR